MGRYKPNVSEIQSLEDADRLLKEMCALETKIERIDSEGDKQIAEIKAKTAEQGKALRERVKELSASLKAYSDYNKSELFKDRKSIDRSFGSFGYRKNPPSITTAKDTVELLEKLGMSQYVRVKREVDKEALMGLDDETLATVNAVRKAKEEFFVQPKREMVNQDILAASA
ncbi:MAG TPA: host-nuclease inhibitor Gam family protein [Spirochaetales bacterium]|nr:host-nuclease inhibitor Gam family protein [Spirochaetales bacterium]